MKNNIMDKVSINNSQHPKARFNLSHDVSSTYQFGEVQPVVSKLMIPDESDSISISSMVRLAPMVAPTFGRIKHKEWHHFVPLSDLWPHVGNFFSETMYSSHKPTSLPHMRLGFLSLFCLVGAKLSLYDSPDLTGTDDDSSLYVIWKIGSPFQSLPTEAAAVLNRIKAFQGASNAFGFNSAGSLVDWSVNSGYSIDAKWFVPASVYSDKYNFSLKSLPFPVSNFNDDSFFDIIGQNDLAVAATSLINDTTTVSLDSADAVIPFQYTYSSGGALKNRVVLVACRFSNFGRRLYKILVGCGYQFDLSSSQEVSLMPLFAFYKAYFDQFGLNRLQSWNTTRCYELLRKIDYNCETNLNDVFDSNSSVSIGIPDLFKFIRELGTCFVTEDIDYVSAHTLIQPNTTSGSNTDSGSFISGNVPLSPTVNIQSAYNSRQMVDANSPDVMRADNVMSLSPSSNFAAIDIKTLMRMYRWMNRTSLAGQEVEKVLRAQGYGYFLYSCKSNFVGYTEQIVPVYDVVNSSDTYDSATGQGMLLGDYAGRGIGYEESKPLTFKADEHGYWIGLCAIVPESGYTQGLDGSVLAVDKFDMYNPEFDGVGFEVSPKSTVCGSLAFGDATNPNRLKDGFGFVPRYSSLKVQKNIANGGFSLRSGRQIFKPYTLDKQIDVGERFIGLNSDQVGYTYWRVAKVFKPSLFPEAGDFWRFVNRYPWLGNFDRIFSTQMHNSDVLNMLNVLNDNPFFEFVVWNDDNFMIHHILNHIAWANMLPISDSFDTDIEHDGHHNDSIEMN